MCGKSAGFPRKCGGLVGGSHLREEEAKMNLGLVRSAEFEAHETGAHPETAARLKRLRSVWPDFPQWKEQPLREASDEQLSLCHDPAVLTRVAELTARGGGRLDADTVVSPGSDRAARMAVGSSIDLVDAVLDGRLDRGFAAVRPPGHHATPSRSMGFCLYSTAALAAQHAVTKRGLQRVLLLDWDVHHGNGSQDCLEAQPAVQFVSLHQWPLYPGSGWFDERGCGNLWNLPLPAGSSGDDFLWALEQLIEPRLAAWNPQLILVSAGYDAHRDDPLGSMALSGADFGRLASRLAGWAEQFCQGRLLGFLEGGYDLDGLAESVAATLTAWQQPHAQPVPADAQRVSPAVRARVQEIASFWAPPGP